MAICKDGQQFDQTNAKFAAALNAEHPFDLEDLREIFTSGAVQVVEIDVASDRKVTALLAEEFNELPAKNKVPEVASRLIERFNGILFASDPDRSLVHLGAIYERMDGGGWDGGDIYASATASARGRSRAIAVAIGPDGLPAPAVKKDPRQIAWFESASDSEDPDPATDVLRPLSGNPDWYDLWKAEEVMHSDQHALPSWPKDEIAWLGATAARYRHSPSHHQGRKARKWLQDDNKPEMELSHARRLVGTVAAAWLDWKARMVC